MNRNDFSRVFVKEHNNQFQTIHVLDLFHSDKRMENRQYDIVYGIMLDNEYRRLLQAAGFESVQIYGDYDRSPYNQKSKRLIVVAR